MSRVYAARTPANPPRKCGATGHKRRGRKSRPGSTRITDTPAALLEGRSRQPAHYYNRWGRDEVSTATEKQHRTTAPDLLGLLGASLEELGDHIETFDREAPGYARRYAEYMIGPKRKCPPRSHGLHPLLAQLVREEVLDQAAAARRSWRTGQ